MQSRNYKTMKNICNLNEHKTLTFPLLFTVTKCSLKRFFLCNVHEAAKGYKILPRPPSMLILD